MITLWCTTITKGLPMKSLVDTLHCHVNNYPYSNRRNLMGVAYLNLKTTKDIMRFPLKTSFK